MPSTGIRFVIGPLCSVI